MKLQYEALLLNFCQLKSFNYVTMFGASGDLISLCKNNDFILLCVTLLRSRVGLVYLHPEFYEQLCDCFFFPIQLKNLCLLPQRMNHFYVCCDSCCIWPYFNHEIDLQFPKSQRLPKCTQFTHQRWHDYI